jgi:membrane protein
MRKTIALITCAARHWSADGASSTGAALAFFCAFSLAPLLVILLTTAGWIIGADHAYTQIGAQLTALFGPATAKTLLAAMKSSQHPEGLIATATSAVTLLIGATTVLAALESALDRIWESGSLVPSGAWGWVRARFLSLGLILTLGFLLLISLTISTGLAGIRERLAEHHAVLVGSVGAIDFLLSLLLVAGLFALIFRYMPARELPWRVVTAGGVLTALLFDGGRWGIGLYLAHSTQPSAFGAAASFAALLLWLYYTAQIFLFGAEFTACLGGLRSGPPVANATGAAEVRSQMEVAQPTTDRRRDGGNEGPDQHGKTREK